MAPPMSAEVPEADLVLEELQRVLVVAAQGEFDAAGAHAVAPGVGEPSGALDGDADHPFSFLNRSYALLCRSRYCCMFFAFNSPT